jgi:thiol-disulfide isomerase/thioredoxin
MFDCGMYGCTRSAAAVETRPGAAAAVTGTAARRSALRVAAGLGAAALLPPLQAAPAERGQPVAWPRITLLDGRVLEPSHWAGRVGVVVFWATTCPFCRRHNQHVEKLQQAARAAGAAMTILGAARDTDAALIRRYAAAQGYSFAITQDVAPLAAAMAPRNLIPQTAVIGRDGRLVHLLPGEMFEEDLMELLALAETKPAPARS